MQFMVINHEELSALNGLPHLQQLLYLRGIKPFVDNRTGITGVMRGISYQSLSEELYIEPHQGIKSGSPSKDQIRRAIKGLEKAGLLRIQSMEWKLIFQCLLITPYSPNQNKATLKQHNNCAVGISSENNLKSYSNYKSLNKPTTTVKDKAAIPQEVNNNYLFVCESFEKFWDLYPKKNAKQKALEEFKAINPSETLLTQMLTALQNQIHASNTLQSHGQWTPKWKFPANWLAQHCWEDEINTTKEIQNANHQKRDTATRPVDPFWDSCKAGAKYVMSKRTLIGSQQTEGTH